MRYLYNTYPHKIYRTVPPGRRLLSRVLILAILSFRSSQFLMLSICPYRAGHQPTQPFPLPGSPSTSPSIGIQYSFLFQYQYSAILSLLTRTYSFFDLYQAFIKLFCSPALPADPENIVSSKTTFKGRFF